jgi:hypothetical protein
METLIFILLLSISFASILIGLFIFAKPTSAFEIQKRFYALINWRIEPISLQKEIRNTKIMGLFLIVLGFSTIAYIVLMKSLG